MQFRPLFVCLGAAAMALAAETAVVEEIVAKVNGDIITRSEIDRDRRLMETELKARGASAADIQRAVSERSKDLLKERIDKLLLVQKGKELNIAVETEVSKTMAELQLQSKISDPEKFQSFIREQTGQTYEDYKSELRNHLLTQRVVSDQVGRDINIPRTEVQKYYDEHKGEFMRDERVFLREITLLTEGKNEAQIEKLAKDIAARARKGEKFHELVRQYSESATKDQYGELGGFKREELDPQIQSLIWDKERGHVTDPIKRSNGFMVLRVDEHHKAGLASLEEVENEIMERLYRPQFEPKVRQYLTRLREEAFLEIKDGYIDTGAAPGKSTKWTDPAQLKPETVTKEEVAAQKRRRRFLWAIPIPGTETTAKQKPGVSSSK